MRIKVMSAVAAAILLSSQMSFGDVDCAYGADDSSKLIGNLEIVDESTSIFAIGRGDELLIAIVHMADGSIATGDNAKVRWEVLSPDGRPADCAVYNPQGVSMPVEWPYYDRDGKEHDLKGCSAISLSIPFGSPAGWYKVRATSVANPDREAAEYDVLADYKDWVGETFYRFEPGSAGQDVIAGAAPQVRESYDKESREYKTTLPRCTWSTELYRFAGWSDGKGVYPAGTPVSTRESEYERTFTALWEPRFVAPWGVRVKCSGKGLRLDWHRVLGGGYTVWRAAPRRPYRKVASLVGDTATTWTDRKVRRDRYYRYKVSAWREGADGRQETPWGYTVRAVSSGSRRSNVSRVVLSVASLRGRAGSEAPLRAAARPRKGKRGVRLLSKELRWYSSDPSVARVDGEGKLHLVAEGSCRVWAKAHNGKNSKYVIVTVE